MKAIELSVISLFEQLFNYGLLGKAGNRYS